MNNHISAPRNEDRLIDSLGAGELLGPICTEWFKPEGARPLIRLATICQIQIIAGPGNRIGLVTWGQGDGFVESSFKNNTLEIGDAPDMDPDFPLQQLLQLGIVAPRDADVHATLRKDEASISISDQIGNVTLDMAGRTFAHVDKASSLTARLDGRSPRMHDHPILWATFSRPGNLDVTVANGAQAQLRGKFADVRLTSRDPGSRIDAVGKLSGGLVAESDGYVTFRPGSVQDAPGPLDVVLGREWVRTPPGPSLVG